MRVARLPASYGKRKYKFRHFNNGGKYTKIFAKINRKRQLLFLGVQETRERIQLDDNYNFFSITAGPKNELYNVFMRLLHNR